MWREHFHSWLKIKVLLLFFSPISLLSSLHRWWECLICLALSFFFFSSLPQTVLLQRRRPVTMTDKNHSQSNIYTAKKDGWGSRAQGRGTALRKRGRERIMRGGWWWEGGGGGGRAQSSLSEDIYVLRSGPWIRIVEFPLIKEGREGNIFTIKSDCGMSERLTERGCCFLRPQEGNEGLFSRTGKV